MENCLVPPVRRHESAVLASCTVSQSPHHLPKSSRLASNGSTLAGNSAFPWQNHRPSQLLQPTFVFLYSFVLQNTSLCSALRNNGQPPDGARQNFDRARTWTLCYSNPHTNSSLQNHDSTEQSHETGCWHRRALDEPDNRALESFFRSILSIIDIVELVDSGPLRIRHCQCLAMDSKEDTEILLLC